MSTREGITYSNPRQSTLFSFYSLASGNVTYPEFLTMMTELRKLQQSVDELHKVFVDMDTDSTGYLSKEEIRVSIVEKGNDITAEDMEDVMEQMDLNADGKINYKGNVSSKIWTIITK